MQKSTRVGGVLASSGFLFFFGRCRVDLLSAHFQRSREKPLLICGSHAKKAKVRGRPVWRSELSGDSQVERLGLPRNCLAGQTCRRHSLGFYLVLGHRSDSDSHEKGVGLTPIKIK